MLANHCSGNITAYQKNQKPFFTPQPIVIVDDDVDDRLLLSRQLRSFLPKETPLVIMSGAQELQDYLEMLEMENIEAEEFEVEIPEMIFLDLLMPVRNGIEALKLLRRQSIWSDVPVTLVTCSRDDHAIQEAEEAGANAFLPKPFSKRDIIEVLNRASNFSPNIT